MTDRAIIYGRASRDPKSAGTSVAKQISRGEAWAAAHNVAVVETVRDDNRSASRGTRVRPGFLKVVELVERGAADLLILWEVSRASRDMEEFAGLINACQDAGVAIVADGSKYDPRLPEQRTALLFGGIMADSEAQRIKRRNQDSVNTNALRGTPHGRIPYGYRREYDPKTGVLINQTPYDERNPTRLSQEAQVLHAAVDAVLQGVTLRAICRDLTARGIPTPRKPRARTLEDNPAGVVASWDPSTLRQLLLNPTIAGRRVHRGEDIGPASWEPIVEYGKWLRLRAYMKDPARLTVSNPRGPAPRHLMSGIAKCGACGGRMKAALNLSRIDRAYVCRNEGCMKVTVVADRVDERVEAVIFALFDRPDFQAALAAAYERREKASTGGPDIGALISDKEAEFEAIDAYRAVGQVGLEAYLRETKRIEEAIEGLRNRQTAAVSSPALKRLVTAESLRKGWQHADLMDRREIVRLLLDVTVKRAVTLGRSFDPNRLDITQSKFLASG